MSQHIQPLFDGPVDIVGDIHGEIGALESLLARLGYARDGRHPRGRRLVFVGDLVDRGKDSPAVVECVAEMVIAGRAQCVLGNHELNLIRGEHKEGNGWFWPEGEDHDRAAGHFLSAANATPSQRQDILSWFASLPVALERPDLRVVHACWEPTAISALQRSSLSTADAYQAFSEHIAEQLAQSGRLEQRLQELDQWGFHLTDPHASVPMLEGIAAIDSIKQSAHPLKAATSGLERPASAPFFATGKWRMTERVAWWNVYDDAPAVVFGHYWRWPLPEEAATARARGPNLFNGSQPFAWLGPRGNALCIDWCAGIRWKERADGRTNFEGKLGALRWPEREVVLDS